MPIWLLESIVVRPIRIPVEPQARKLPTLGMPALALFERT
jgi:hypothetical protein